MAETILPWALELAVQYGPAVASAAGGAVFLKLAQAFQNRVSKNYDETDMKNILGDVDAAEVAKIILKNEFTEGAGADSNMKFACFIIKNSYLDDKQNPADVDLKDKVNEVRDALKTAAKSRGGTSLPNAGDFSAEAAVTYWKDNGKLADEELLKKLFKPDTGLEENTRIWMITMALDGVFANIINGISVTGVKGDLKTVISAFQDELAKQAQTVSLQDSKGGRVDFSANPKALFAPPRDASEANLGAVDIGVLGDAYICGFGSSHKHKWVLLPSCLQRFAYELIFRDSSVARFAVQEKERSKMNISRMLLF
jgi:hypothetical protein